MFKKLLKLKNLYFSIILLFLFSWISFHNEYRDVRCFIRDNLISDLVTINNLAKQFNFDVYILDPSVLSILEERNGIFNSYSGCLKGYTSFGIDIRFVEKVGLKKIMNLLKNDYFEVATFYNLKTGIETSRFGVNLPVTIILRKSYVYIIHIIYTREDNTWWFGSIGSDVQCSAKLQKLLLSYLNCSSTQWNEMALNKHNFIKKSSLEHFLIPQDEQNFFTELNKSNFIECNSTRAALFRKTYRKNVDANAQRFKHKAWKLLSKTKTILDLLSISFWLSSGTCLGYFRECDIIAHSKDVDIGVLAKDFNETMIYFMESHGLKLKHWFGLANDSLELSFIDEGGIKLDIFFFYEDGIHLWNGGTQLRTGRKFKYLFPKFDLCWTLFCGLKVRVPCQTESYILANYGSDWFTPIEKWDWKTSPNNVQPNGVWPIEISQLNFHRG